MFQQIPAPARRSSPPALLAVALAALRQRRRRSRRRQDLAGNRVGAMAELRRRRPVQGDRAARRSRILYNNHPNYPLKDDWLFWSGADQADQRHVRADRRAAERLRAEAQRARSAPATPRSSSRRPTTRQEDAFVASGAILPVSDYIDLMPNFKDKIAKWNLEPDIDTLRQEDGKFYLLPGLHEKPWQDYSLAVRTDILEQLGPAVPKTWDELYTVLKAMKAAYPDVVPVLRPVEQAHARRQPAEHPRPGLRHPRRLGLPARHLGRRRQEVRLHRRQRRVQADGRSTSTSWSSERLLDPESFTQTDDAGACRSSPTASRS